MLINKMPYPVRLFWAGKYKEVPAEGQLSQSESGWDDNIEEHLVSQYDQCIERASEGKNDKNKGKNNLDEKDK